MSRGRPPRKNASLISRACDFVEHLEERKYLTTLSSNGGTTTFNYYDANKHNIQVELVGKISVELVGARLASNGNLVIRDLVTPPPPNSNLKVDGVNLFQIYVASAAPDAQIIISQYTINNGVITYTPYSGGGEIGITPNVGNTRIYGLGQGGVFIGAQVPINGNAGGDPITFSPRKTGLGLRPAGKPYFAGIQTAPGVSLGKVLIGGTITGIVNIAGNVNEFYAGNVLTGDSQGISYLTKTSIPNNFQIGGDLRALLVSGSIGTVANEIGVYRAGTNLLVGGKLGYLHVGGNNSSSVTVNNSSSVPGLTTPVQEAEYTLIGSETPGSVFMSGELAGSFFTNDSTGGEGTPAVENNFQFSNTYTSSTTGAVQTMEFQGTLDGVDGDNTDAYGLPLMAGQSVILHLDSTTPDQFGLTAGTIGQLGVFDPLGRLVATDLPELTGTANQPFSFTAKTPGVYRLVVAMPGDTLFNGTGPNKVPVSYTLSVNNAGEVAVGGIDVGASYAMMEPGNGIAVRTGDLGAIQAAGELAAASYYQIGSGSPIAAAKGNLRAITANQIGSNTYGDIGGQTAQINLFGDLVVPRGSVGYIRSNGLLALNYGGSSGGNPIPSSAIGFDYQRVEAGGALDANLIANRAIGTIIAGSVGDGATFFTPVISANTDNKGYDGTIDVIYVTGDFGSATSGGPVLLTGLGGNVKYVYVGGAAYRDSYFGGSAEITTTVKFNQKQQYTDDSGAKITLAPTTVTTGSTTGTTTTVTTTSGELGVRYYPMRNGGGVILDVTSTTSLTASASGGGEVDIGKITTASAGSPAIFSAYFNTTGYALSGTTTGTGTSATQTLTSPQPSVPNVITLAGSAPINVMNITGNDITTLLNATGGEIASVNAASLGYFTAQSAGFVRSTIAGEVDLPTNLTSTAFPFNPYSMGLDVTGSAVSIVTRDGLGNVNVGNAIGNVVTNAGHQNAKGALDGIVGAVAGRVVQNVNIGEGVAATGTGSVVGGGIFGIGSTAEIQNVVGENADIRGYIASEGKIDNIRLNNGSLLGAKIVTSATIAESAFTNNQFTFNDTEYVAGQSDEPGGVLVLPPNIPIAGTVLDYSLGSINVSGSGGILGTEIAVGDFNQINAGGFGIVSSYIAGTATFNPDNAINAGGLGIRASYIDVGTGVNSINVNAGANNGAVLNVNDFSPTARPSSKHAKFDYAGNGRLLSGVNDLNRLLGTSNAHPKRSGATNGGLLVDTSITGNGQINNLNAYLIGSTDTSTDVGSTSFPMRISVANSIKKVNATYISGLQLSTGILSNLTVAKDIMRANMTTSNSFGNVKIGGNMAGSTTMVAAGTVGSINAIDVGRALYGTIVARGDINAIQAGSIGGYINTSSNLGSLLVSGDLLPSADIRAKKKLNRLFIAGDVETGAQVHAGSYGTKHIGGHNYGTVGTL